MKPNSILDHDGLNLKLINLLMAPPEPFTPGESQFWDDPYISGQMLAAHLNPKNDLASRRPETIDRSVNWLVETLGLGTGAAVLDLGCGPGLYAIRFAQHGLKVTGVDYSRRSIEYAIQNAQKQKLDIEYRYQNYLHLADSEKYDAVFLIYGDFCPLSPDARRNLLHNVHRALKPGGFFILDVTTRAHRKLHGSVNNWYLAENGFWKPGAHLVLEEGFDYPDQSIFLDQAIVIDANGKVFVYRMWFQDFTRESVTLELEREGFLIQSIGSDLCGSPYKDGTEWIGIITKKS